MAGGISRMAKRELLATISDRYRTSSRREKTRILDEFIAVTGHHRKHGIRPLGQPGNEGGHNSVESRYYLLSQAFPPERFNQIAQAHWGIENQLHWVAGRGVQ